MKNRHVDICVFTSHCNRITTFLPVILLIFPIFIMFLFFLKDSLQEVVKTETSHVLSLIKIVQMCNSFCKFSIKTQCALYSEIKQWQKNGAQMKMIGSVLDVRSKLSKLLHALNN